MIKLNMEQTHSYNSMGGGLRRKVSAGKTPVRHRPMHGRDQWMYNHISSDMSRYSGVEVCKGIPPDSNDLWCMTGMSMSCLARYSKNRRPEWTLLTPFATSSKASTASEPCRAISDDQQHSRCADPFDGVSHSHVLWQ